MDDFESDSNIDYKNLIKAVVENAVVDYVKLQHPKNRLKKYLKEAFQSAEQMFFDPEYTFEAFYSQDTQKYLNTKDLISIMIDSSNVSLEKTKQHVIDKSIEYWWEKNFHDFKVPSKFTLVGKVWHVHNAQLQKIDYENLRVYLPLKKAGVDRLYIKSVLSILLQELNIDLSESDFNNLYKFLYLFLKINDAFN